MPSGLCGIVEQIYEAALDNSLWAGISGRIATAFEATSAVLKVHDADHGIHMLETTPNMVVAPHLEDWAQHWHQHDLWVQRSVSFGISRIVTSDDLVTPEEQARSGFYQEWLPHLDIHHMIGAVFSAENGGVGVIGIHRPPQARPFDATDRQATAMLLPHLERAMRISHRLGTLSSARDAAFRSFDALDAGVIIADASGRVRHVSSVAEAMLARNSQLMLRDGRLCAPAPALQTQLAGALRATIDVAAGRGLSLPATMRIDREARPAWSVAVSPLTPRSTHTGWEEPLALILLRDPEYPPYRIDQLRAIYGLTQMEAVTAAALACGQSLQAIGLDLEIGIGTVRTHLKQVMLKTGTNRQAEAVALLARSVAAFYPH